MSNYLRRRLEQLGGDKQALIAELVASAGTNATLQEELILLGAQVMVGKLFVAGRRLPSEAYHETKRRFMDEYRLFGGNITLAEATKQDLLDSAQQHTNIANTHLGEATFERRVADGLPLGKRVHEVYTDKKLTSLRSGA